MPRKGKAAPVLKPCRRLSIGEACVLLLVRPEWQTLDGLHEQAAGMPLYELRGYLGVLGVLSLAVFSAGLAASFKTAAQFQQVMADIKALTQPTAEGFLQLKEAALNLGAPLGVGARESAAAILELNRAGLSAADAINGGLVGALTLAGAAGISAAEGGKLATAAMTAFGLAAEDMPRIADVFANFANQTFLGANDLSQAIAAVGPVAQTAGLELDQFSGYMAALAQGGFKRMSDAGTSLKVMLLSLMSPATTAAKQMEKLGFSSYDAAGNLRPFNDILGDLRERLKGMSEQGQNRVLRDLFGTDGIRAATILLKQSREEVDAVIASQGKLGEAARVAGERLESYNGSVAKLGAAWETFRITIGEKLLPVMTDLVDGLKSGVDTLQDFANGTESIVPYIAPILGAFIALKGAAIAAAAPAIWAALVAAISGFFTTITVFVASNPLGALALAVSALAVVINKLYADTANIYDQMDRSNAESSAALTKRAAELRAEGTELGRVQAKYLESLDRVAKAEQGNLTGTNFFGERNYAKDAVEMEAAGKEAARLRDEMVQLRTEAQRHGQITATPGGPGLTPGQIEKREEALQSLREALNEKAFTLKVEGMTELDAALAKTGREFDALRIKVKAAFGGNLNNTELLAALGELDAGLAAQQAATRQKFADQAVKSATESAKQVQDAEISAMRDGQAKTAALRQLELDDIQLWADEKIKTLSKFPGQQQQLESDTRRIIAATKQKYAAEDIKLAEDNAKRVLDAEASARDAQIAAMEDGRAKREAIRGKEVDDLRASIAEKVAALAGDPERQRGVQIAGNDQIASKIREQAQQRVKEEQDAQVQVTAARKAARDSAVALITDEAQKRHAAREDEMAGFKDALEQRLKAVEGYPEKEKQIWEAARKEEQNLEQKWAKEDDQDAKARAQRIVDAYQKTQDAQFTAQQAGRSNQAAQYELGLSRQLAAVKDNALKTAQLEATAIQQRARFAEAEAQAQYAQDEKRFTDARDRALSNDQLSREERENVWRTFYASLSQLSGDFQAGEKKRLQQREADEREAAQRIQEGRLSEAVKPVKALDKDAEQLRFQQGMTESLTERLVLEQQIEMAAAKQAVGYGKLLEKTAEIQLTEEQREAMGEKLENSNRAVLTSQKAQLDYQKQINAEAQGLVDLYGKLVVLTDEQDTGMAAAQREYAQATDELGDAFAKALPFLYKFKDSSLKPDDFNDAKDALGGLIDALEDQRQKLEKLRGEYDRQRDALSSIQDVLKGFGQEFGDVSLLDNAIGYNQITYNAAKNALDELVKGGKYDAAQLAEALKGVQTGYDGLKGAVTALGDARAKESEKEIARIKKESDARLKVVDDQIAAAKKRTEAATDPLNDQIAVAKERGDKAAVERLEKQRDQIVKSAEQGLKLLEKQREAIVTSTEQLVTQLETKAAAARDQAQKALADRTGGLPQLLQGAQDAAVKASQAVDKLPAEIKKAEKDVALSAKAIRGSLSDAFTGLPAIAGRAGADSGKQFMDRLRKELKTVKLPGITGSGAAALPSSRAAVNHTVFNITMNGQTITGTANPNIKTLLKALSAEADAECRRRGQ